MEVACNLLDTEVSPPEAVQKRLEEFAAELEGPVHIEQGYVIGFTKEEVIGIAQSGEAT